MFAVMPSLPVEMGGEVHRSADAARAEILYDARRFVTSRNAAPYRKAAIGGTLYDQTIRRRQ
jgi:hypothetical protein